MINEKIQLNDVKKHETHLLIHQTFVHLTERVAHSQQNQVRHDDVQQVQSTERKAHAPGVLTAVPFEQLALQAIFDYLGSNGSYQEISLLVQKLTEILANGATNASNRNKSSSC